MDGVELRLLTMEPGFTVLVDGEEHRFTKPKERLILAILLLRSGPVSIDALVDCLWEENPPAKARDSLRSHISRLRGRLAMLTNGAISIVCRAGTYDLRVDPDAVDLFRFRELVRQADALAGSKDLAGAVRLLREAQRLWPGEALAGLDNSWARVQAEQLAEERLAAIKRRIDLELQLGCHREVTAELRHLSAAHPLDEALAGYLMTALYRSGRRAAALQVYRQIRERVREELGTEPGEELAEVHRRVLGYDAILAITPVHRRGGRQPQPNTLAEDVPHFVGREREIELLDVTRADRPGPGVVVLEGMPGVGKTALAVHAAHLLANRFPDALLQVNMRGHDGMNPPLDAAQAVSELLRALGIPATRIPAAPDARFRMWQEALRHRRAIVILDDAAGIEQVRPLLPRWWPGLMLITSRERFPDTDGVRRVPLDVLPDGDAARLCTSLAVSDADPRAVGEVVDLCGGLPLAITLMAPQIGSWHPGFARGQVGRPAARSGHHIVGDNEPIRRAFELSYRDLRPETRLAFRRLGLHPCPDFTVEVCAVLTGLPVAGARAALRELSDHHLVREGGIGRYRFHDLIRWYARDLALREEPRAENRMAIERLLGHYLRRTEAADRAAYPHRWRVAADASAPDLDVLTPEAARRWLADEWRNALALAAYAGDHEWKAQGAQLAHLLAEFLDDEGLREEAMTAHARALHACNLLGDHLRIAQAALDLGRVQLRVWQQEDALRNSKIAQRYFQAAGEPRGEAKARDQIGLVLWASDRCREALAMHEEAEAICRAIGDVQGEAIILDHKAMAQWHLGDNAEAQRLYQVALGKCREVGDRQTEARILNNLGHVLQSRGRHREADELYQRCAEICAEISAPRPQPYLHHNRGDLYRYKGRYEQALECYRIALALYQDTGDRRNEAEVLNGIGATYLAMSRLGEALIHFEKAKELSEGIASTYHKVGALIGIASVRRDNGRYWAALSTYKEALDLSRQIEDQRQQARIRDQMGDTYRYLGRDEQARFNWRLAADIYRRLGMPEAVGEMHLKIDPLNGAAS